MEGLARIRGGDPRQIAGAQGAGFLPIHNIWNEPLQLDIIFLNWPGADEQEFLETWLHAYRVSRKERPEAEITGPGYAYWETNHAFRKWRETFRDFCVANDCVPDWWNWHFGEWEWRKDVPWVKSWGLNKGVLIPEYPKPDLSRSPGPMNWGLGEPDYSGVGGACKAVFGDSQKGTFNGCLLKTGDIWQPTVVWWGHKLYANMKGTLLHSDGSTVNQTALAVHDSEMRTISMLVGNSEGDKFKGQVQVRVKNVCPAEDTTVHATLTRI